MEYGPWSLVIDIGLVGALLLVGTLIRRWVPLAQRLMLPSAVLAGFLGLLLGPNVLGVLPFSDQLSTYASVLIAVIFACLALGDEVGIGKFRRATAAFSAYTVASYMLQVGLGMTLALVLFGPLFGTPDGFGLLLFAGWAGGFGTAAAVGPVLEDAGWVGAETLAFTSATVGTFVGIAVGIALTNWGARAGYTVKSGRFEDLPEALRTGLVREGPRDPVGYATTSPASIEPLAFQGGLIAAITAAAYGLTELLEVAFPAFTLPVLTFAFLVGLVVKAVLRRTPAWSYTDQTSIKTVSGVSTDVLIVCGIASIVPGFVASYVVPLTILMVVGLVLCLVLFRWVAPVVLAGAWFEKSIFTWGWATGAVSTSIALLRIIDPKLESKTLEEYGMAYMPVAPLETVTIIVTPLMVVAGVGWAVGAGWTAFGLLALALPFVFGWARANPTPATDPPAGERAA